MEGSAPPTARAFRKELVAGIQRPPRSASKARGGGMPEPGLTDGAGNAVGTGVGSAVGTGVGVAVGAGVGVAVGAGVGVASGWQ